MATRKQPTERLSLSLGAKFRQEQFDDVVARAAHLGIDKSEFVRQCVLTALNPKCSDLLLLNQIEDVLQPILEELLALRGYVLNRDATRAKDMPWTIEHLEATRAHVDAHKAERARARLDAAKLNRTEPKAGLADEEAA